MQLLSREQFFKLASMPDLTEGSKKFNYDDFIKDSLAIYNDADTVESAYRKVEKTLIKPSCPPIVLCGKGSSRAAFCISGGKCLKMAMTDAGIAQNKHEAQIFLGKKSYLCFPQTYGYEKQKGTSLLTDCCTKAKESDFQKLYGVKDILGLCAIVLAFIKTKKKPVQALGAAIRNCFKNEELMIDFEDEEDVEEICQNIAEAKKPKWKCIHDWILFYFDNSKGSDKSLLIGDLERYANWGLRKSGKDIIPTILDAGFSNEVKNKYYDN